MRSWRWHRPARTAGDCESDTASSAVTCSPSSTTLRSAPPAFSGAGYSASERELRPTATYRKVTGGFRSEWGASLFAAVRSVIGTAARRGIDAYQAIRMTLQGQTVLAPG